jgi:hypothetical protein
MFQLSSSCSVSVQSSAMSDRILSKSASLRRAPLGLLDDLDGPVLARVAAFAFRESYEHRRWCTQALSSSTTTLAQLGEQLLVVNADTDKIQ